MAKTVKISFSAVSHIGSAKETNTNRIYANGRFNDSFENENLRLALEASGQQFLFALSDGMEINDFKTNTRISITNELKRLKQKAKYNADKEIQYRVSELADVVEQTSNLIHSLSVSSEDGQDVDENKPSFAGLFIENGKGAIIKFGSCSIYKLEDDMLKALANEHKKAERLLKMGIINDEQAEIILSKQEEEEGNSEDIDKKTEIYDLRSGDTFLICSKGITDAVSEDTMSDIVTSNSNIDEAAAMLVREAISNFASDNLTAVLVKVEEATGESGQVSVPSAAASTRRRLYAQSGRVHVATRKRRPNYSRMLSMSIILLISVAIIFGAFTIWKNLRNNAQGALADGGGKTVAGDIDNTRGDDNDDLDIDSDDTTGGAEGGEGTSGTAPAGQSGGNGAQSSISEITYTVKAGDNLMAISRKFYGDPNKYRLIMEANKLENPDKIYVGQSLKIPPEE